MTKRRANNFAPIPRKFDNFDTLLKNSDFGTINGNIFYRTVASANKITLIFLAVFDWSFLNSIHSVLVDATFKTIPTDFSVKKSQLS